MNNDPSEYLASLTPRDNTSYKSMGRFLSDWPIGGPTSAGELRFGDCTVFKAKLPWFRKAGRGRYLAVGTNGRVHTVKTLSRRSAIRLAQHAEAGLRSNNRRR